MLSPLAELDAAGPEVATLGLRSVPLWSEVAQRLAVLDGAGDATRYFRQRGSLMLAHGRTWARRSGARAPVDRASGLPSRAG